MCSGGGGSISVGGGAAAAGLAAGREPSPEVRCRL